MSQKKVPLRPEGRKKAAQSRRRMENSAKIAVIAMIAVSAVLLVVMLNR